MNIDLNKWFEEDTKKIYTVAELEAIKQLEAIGLSEEDLEVLLLFSKGN